MSDHTVMTERSLSVPDTVTAVRDDVAIRTVPLGGGALSRALQELGSDASKAWMPPRPADAEAWRARALAVRAAHATPDWFMQLAPAFAATGRAAERLSTAAQHGVVVTTGQQPGLFGGPTYTWTKAVGALAFADALQQDIAMPVAPVFWAATDDSDWMEASVTHLLMSDGLKTIGMSGPATDGISMMDVPLGDVTAQIAALRDASGSAAASSVLELVESAYVPHATVGAAYLQLLRALLEPMGIAVIDASHPALRNAADPFLRRALTRAAPVAEALATRTADIERAGFRPQVDAIDALSLVFQTRLGNSGRSQDRTRVRIPVADAARVAREAELGTLGANVLLRPVLERCLLPTVCYWAGPGEFAYFAQVTSVADALEAEVPLPLPRWAAEVIEQRSVRSLDALGLDEDSLRDPHAAEIALARRVTDEGVQDAVERLRVTLDAQSRALASAVDAADAIVPPAVVDGLSRDLLRRIDRLDRRITAAVKRREVDLMQRAAHVRAAFRPFGGSPERALNLMPVLARYGVAVLEQLRDAAGEHARAVVHGTAESSDRRR